MIPGLGRSPGEGKDNPPWYSCLGYPMNREAWWATVHGVTKSQTRLSTHKEHPAWCLVCNTQSVLVTSFLMCRGKQLWVCLPGTSHLGETHRCQEDVMIKALTGSDGAFTLIRGDREDLLVRWRVGKNRRVKGILGGWHLWRPFQWVGPVSLAQRGNSGVF